MSRTGVSRRGFLGRLMAGTLAAAGVPVGLAPRRVLAAPAPAGTLRFGIQTWPQNATWAGIAGAWQEAEELGFDSAFAFDHFVPIRDDPSGPCFEGWTLLSALAAKTSRIGVGLLVTGNTYRHPPVLAKMAATVDHVSGGRVILGMGAGWFELEHEAYGIPFHTAGGRARRLVEAVEVVKLLFTKERPSFDGKYYRLREAPFQPKPVQKPHPPILIGGMGPKVIQPLAARHADIWHFFAGEPAEAKAVVARFDAICREVGRDPAAVWKSVSLRANEIAGTSAKALRERVRAFADSGVRYFILSLQAPYDRAELRRFAKEVVGPMREA